MGNGSSKLERTREFWRVSRVFNGLDAQEYMTFAEGLGAVREIINATPVEDKLFVRASQLLVAIATGAHKCPPKSSIVYLKLQA